MFVSLLAGWEKQPGVFLLLTFCWQLAASKSTLGLGNVVWVCVQDEGG